MSKIGPSRISPERNCLNGNDLGSDFHTMSGMVNTERRRLKMPLLPQAHGGQQPPRKHPSALLGVCYGRGDVTGNTGSVPEMIQTLGKFRRSDVIRWVVTISGWITEDVGVKPDNQMAMGRALLSAKIIQNLEQFVSRPDIERWAFFNRRGIWFVLQMAILGCQEDVPECAEDHLRNAVGECCLMANDVMQQLGPKDVMGDTEEELSWWSANLIPLFEKKDGHEILCRAQSFWFDIPATDVIRRKTKHLKVKELNEAFEAKYKVSLWEFFLILYNLYVGFEAHAISNKCTAPLALDQ